MFYTFLHILSIYGGSSGEKTLCDTYIMFAASRGSVCRGWPLVNVHPSLRLSGRLRCRPGSRGSHRASRGALPSAGGDSERVRDYPAVPMHYRRESSETVEIMVKWNAYTRERKRATPDALEPSRTAITPHLYCVPLSRLEREFQASPRTTPRIIVCPRADSNGHYELRRLAFYPLNYEDVI